MDLTSNVQDILWEKLIYTIKSLVLRKFCFSVFVSKTNPSKQMIFIQNYELSISFMVFGCVCSFGVLRWWWHFTGHIPAVSLPNRCSMIFVIINFSARYWLLVKYDLLYIRSEVRMLAKKMCTQSRVRTDDPLIANTMLQQSSD